MQDLLGGMSVESGGLVGPVGARRAHLRRACEALGHARCVLIAVATDRGIMGFAFDGAVDTDEGLTGYGVGAGDRRVSRREQGCHRWRAAYGTGGNGAQARGLLKLIKSTSPASGLSSASVVFSIQGHE